MNDCLFCKIINGDIPSDKIYEDDKVYAFSDISPTAPVHILIVPKEHIPTINDLTEKNSPVIGHIFNVAKKIAEENEGKTLKYTVLTMGSQLNENDSEKISIIFTI